MFLAMIVASAALTKYEVGAQVEACFQNFAAGLILAAGIAMSHFSLHSFHGYVKLYYLFFVFDQQSPQSYSQL
jgi:hypothetical protein